MKYKGGTMNAIEKFLRAEGFKINVHGNAWGTTPSGTVYYSLISPFPPDFEDALVMGAALRCKWKVEDANKELRDDYGISLANALDLITPRDSNNKRRLHRTEPFNSPGGKRIIVRRP